MAVIRPLHPPKAKAGPSQPERPLIESRLQELVIITGFSGAGKSTAMNVFEDAGYFCVDNLPPEMIRSLVELFVHQGSKVERAAVVSDVRGGVYFEALRAVVDDLTRGCQEKVASMTISRATICGRVGSILIYGPALNECGVADYFGSEERARRTSGVLPQSHKAGMASCPSR